MDYQKQKRLRQRFVMIAAVIVFIAALGVLVWLHSI